MGPRRRLEQPQPSPPSPHRPGWRGALGGFYVLMQRQLRSARKIRHRAKAPRLCACWENSIPGRASESRGRLEIVSLMGTQGSPQGRGGQLGGGGCTPLLWEVKTRLVSRRYLIPRDVGMSRSHGTLVGPSGVFFPGLRESSTAPHAMNQH